ncbi:MAG: hypothetical protein KAW41_06740 [Candidatus Diapherotrites archaeon]|nr:hypothetical protein [Candidatus Diapherotrites archaeon]
MEKKNGLVEIFNNAISGVLDFLLIHDTHDYSKSEIAKHSGVAYKTVYDVWPILEGYELVKQTRTIGRAKMYSINRKNPLVKKLKQLQLGIMMHALEANKEKVAAQVRT